MAFRWIWWRNQGVNASGAGSRPTGLQITGPLSYAADAAATVTIDTAFQISAVWACVKLISETIASMPICVYSVDKNGVRTENKDHPVAKLFTGKVNKWQTRPEFIETMTMQIVLQGNCYAFKQKNSAGQLIGLMPLMTQDMQTALDSNGEIFHRYLPSTANSKDFTQDEILHIKGMGNGIIGLSALSYARNSLGIAQASETAVTKIYSNGAKPSGILTIDKVLTDAQRSRVKDNFNDLESGTADRLFVLEAGMDYKQISMTPQDIELLNTRKFQIEDIARFFGVPSVLINDMSSTSVWGSGIQQIVEGWYKLGIRPYLQRYEEAFEQWLLAPEERESIEIEFEFEDFLRPDQAERVKTYGEAVSKGIMTPNEARAMEGWAALEGGDKAYMQQQMIPLDMLGTIQQPAAQFAKTDIEAKMDELIASKNGQTSITLHMPDVNFQAQPINIKGGDVNIPSNITLPQQNVTVEPPSIKVEPPSVNVAAPNVTILPAEVKVDAPNVNVTPEVSVKLPRRKTKTSVKYDVQDRVTETTQIEEDA